jgi:hypothetical protein
VEIENVAHQVRRRFGIPVAPATRPLWLWWRWAAFVVFGLLVLGGVSVASQTVAQEDFDHAVVGRKDGTCVAGAYVVRSDDRLVLAQVGNGRNARVVAIPNDEIRELQVGGPHRRPEAIDTACAADLVTPPIEK